MSKCMSWDSGVYGGVCFCDDHTGQCVGDCGGCSGCSGVSRVADWWTGQYLTQY